MLDDRALFRTHAEHMSAQCWVRFHVSLPDFSCSWWICWRLSFTGWILMVCLRLRTKWRALLTVKIFFMVSLFAWMLAIVDINYGITTFVNFLDDSCLNPEIQPFAVNFFRLMGCFEWVLLRHAKYHLRLGQLNVDAVIWMINLKCLDTVICQFLPSSTGWTTPSIKVAQMLLFMLPNWNRILAW